MIIRAPRPTSAFYILDRRISEDRRLSWAARGLLIFLLGKVDHWQVSVPALVAETQESGFASGRDVVHRLLRELIGAGYMRRRRYADGTMDYLVREPGTDFPDEGAEPQPEKPDTEKPDTDFPDVLVSTEKAASTEKATKKKRASALSGDQLERFATFYAAYPKKRNRADAEKAFAKLNPDDSLLAVLLKAVEVAKRSRTDWRKDGGQFIPYAASWLNARCWEDEPDQVEYTPAEQAVMDAYNELMPGDWARAITTPFSAARASAIRSFLSFAPNKSDMPRRYFGHCAANLAVDERFGFDWLVREETYLRVREGAVKHKEAA